MVCKSDASHYNTSQFGLKCLFNLAMADKLDQTVASKLVQQVLKCVKENGEVMTPFLKKMVVESLARFKDHEGVHSEILRLLI